jgi:hypothetical protein
VVTLKACILIRIHLGTTSGWLDTGSLGEGKRKKKSLLDKNQKSGDNIHNAREIQKKYLAASFQKVRSKN